MLDVNPSLTGLLGCPREQHAGQKLRKVGAFRDMVADRKASRTCQKMVDGRFVTVSLMTAARQIQAQLSSRVCLEGDTRVIQYLVPVPAAPVQETESAAVSGDEWRALFASMPDVVLVIDCDGVYRKIAPTNSRLLYAPPQELHRKNIRVVFPRERAEVLSKTLLQVLETKQTIGSNMNCRLAGAAQRGTSQRTGCLADRMETVALAELRSEGKPS